MSELVSVSPTSTCAYWYEDLKHQGLAPFDTGPDASTYQVFRNVSAYGAKGDGVHDDTDAINLAISSGGRCAPGAPGSGSCNSTTTTPAVVYFPPGTYLVSTPIIDYYYTQLIGNPNCMPVIKANSNFTGSWVIDGDEYFGYNGGGVLGYGATNVFWRQIRNFIIDMTIVPSSLGLAGIHWPTGQATSIQNVVVKMSEASGTGHYGLAIESGSGGFMTDLTFYGGKWGIWVGNQQFTMRNLTFYNSATAIYQLWDWGWTYKGISINNCSIGLDMSNVGADGVTQAVGSVTFIDSSIKDTPIGIKTIHTSTSAPPAGGSLILENVSLDNVATAIEGPTGAILGGTSGTSTINYGQGHEYTPSGPATISGTITPNARPASLTAGSDFYERSKPQYENIPASQFVSVRDAGAKGDGATDDSNALNAILAAAAISGKIVFFDAGDYLVTKTISVPAGVKIVGEAYPVILSSGAFFEDMTNPLPVVQVGLRGDTGSIEWSDMIISTQGAQAGAILIEYNLAAPTTTPAGIWDVHTRIGGFAGSHLQVGDCPKTPGITITPTNFPTQCIGAFMSMHITTLATGLYMENNWLWVADHDVEDQELTQISVYAGRGLLIESTRGGIWLYGTAVEHHSLYQYHISGASNLYMGQIQTETAYYQPNPDATEPFPQDPNYNDPTFTPGQSGWGLLIDNSYDILVYGAGLYSFFNDYNVTCSNQGAGETCQAGIFSVDTVSTVSVYNLNTVGTNDMITRGGTNGQGGTNIALYADNNDGFIGTIALYKNN